MKKKLIVISLILLIMVSTISIAYSTGRPALMVSSATAKPGETVTLSVSIDKNPGINTFALGFDYDDSLLQLLDVQPTKDLGGQFVYGKKAVWLNSQDTTYNGDIMTLTFKVADSASIGNAKVTLKFSKGDISNYSEKTVSFSTESGNISIQGDQAQSETEGKAGLWERIVALINKWIEAIKSFFHIGSN